MVGNNSLFNGFPVGIIESTLTSSGTSNGINKTDIAETEHHTP